MITREEEEKIHILSDTELYPQAVRFMRSLNRSLPAAQINGLLNVSLGNTYAQIETFAHVQYNRTTWKASERHIPEFYRRLTLELQTLEKRALALLSQEEATSDKKREEIKLALVREFIQHLLAENYYMMGTRAFQSAESAGGRPGKPDRAGNDQRSAWSTRGGKKP